MCTILLKIVGTIVVLVIFKYILDKIIYDDTE